ncbi:MAG TPA: coenzyme F420-0:L-glutamate ligase [Chloroflexi bacterium]|nr:coenzyme F420-0:L-glutamate ligase [Chloroflexota bacterium]
MRRVELIGVPGIPLIETGDDLAGVIATSIEQAGLDLLDGDVVVVTSKIVSKSEGRWADLDTITPDAEALRVAEQCHKDPREVALILSESVRISRMRPGVLITEHRLGFVCANAGVDHSNTRPGTNWRLLLPENPDRSARLLRERLEQHFNARLAIVISDSHGRPFRLGTVGVAIGAAGLPALRDLRGTPDLFGVELRVTEVGFADELAASAGLVMGQADDGIPVVIIRGLVFPPDDHAKASDLVRPHDLDLYR